MPASSPPAPGWSSATGGGSCASTSTTMARCISDRARAARSRTGAGRGRRPGAGGSVAGRAARLRGRGGRRAGHGVRAGRALERGGEAAPDQRSDHQLRVRARRDRRRRPQAPRGRVGRDPLRAMGRGVPGHRHRRRRPAAPGQPAVARPARRLVARAQAARAGPRRPSRRGLLAPGAGVERPAVLARRAERDPELAVAVGRRRARCRRPGGRDAFAGCRRDGAAERCPRPAGLHLHQAPQRGRLRMAQRAAGPPRRRRRRRGAPPVSPPRTAAALVTLAALLAAALLLFEVGARQLTGAWFTFGVHPEVLRQLELSLADQKRLAGLDPAGAARYHRRFAAIESLLGRLRILEYNRDEVVGRYQAALLIVFGALAAAAAGVYLAGKVRQQARLDRLRGALARLSAGEVDVEVGERRRDLLGRVGALVEETSRAMARDRRRLGALQNLARSPEAGRRPG